MMAALLLNPMFALAALIAVITLVVMLILAALPAMIELPVVSQVMIGTV